MKDQARVRASSTIVAVERIAGFLINAQETDIRIAEQRPLDAGDGIIVIGALIRCPRAHIHHAKLVLSQRASDLAADINRHGQARVRVNANLSAEEQKILLLSRWKAEHIRVFEKELAGFREEELV